MADQEPTGLLRVFGSLNFTLPNGDVLSCFPVTTSLRDRSTCRPYAEQPYRFALYSRADKLGLAADRGQPVALFACRATAEAHGRKLYGELAEVVELSAEQDLAP